MTPKCLRCGENARPGTARSARGWIPPSALQLRSSRPHGQLQVGTTHKHLRRGVNSEHFNYYLRRGLKSVESKFSSILLDTSYVRATKGARKKKLKIEEKKQFRGNFPNKETRNSLLAFEAAEDWFEA
ncbi:hypothetical protein TNCV_797671 [Trichonephila clavipes]|nr:hypothetical protein TNCV_797671 [Trichonephila clavipes]